MDVSFCSASGCLELSVSGTNYVARYVFECKHGHRRDRHFCTKHAWSEEFFCWICIDATSEWGSSHDCPLKVVTKFCMDDQGEEFEAYTGWEEPANPVEPIDFSDVIRDYFEQAKNGQ